MGTLPGGGVSREHDGSRDGCSHIEDKMQGLRQYDAVKPFRRQYVRSRQVAHIVGMVMGGVDM